MSQQEILAVLTRDKGVFVVIPIPGKSQAESVETLLGMKAGYSTGRVMVDLPDGAEEVWLAWVEGVEPNGDPSFEYRTFPAGMSEEEIEAAVQANGEEILKLGLSKVYRAQD